MSWTREQVSHLIVLYEANPLLYNVKDTKYHNKAARRVCLEDIVKKMILIRPNTTVEMIKTKINTLRTQFNKELSNLRKSQKSGAGCGEVYKASLWCFERLMFLQDSVTLRTTWSNIGNIADDTQQQLDNESEDSWVSLTENVEVVFNEGELNTVETQVQEINLPSTSAVSVENGIKKRKRTRSTSVEDEVLLGITDAIASVRNKDTQEPPNEWDIFSKFVSSEIQSLKLEINKRKLKREIIKTVLNYQEEEDKYM